MDDLTPEALRQLLAEIVSGEKPPARLIGYARVSTEDQNLDLQIDALKRAGVAADDVYVEKISGAAKRRPALQRALKALRAGDALVVWKLDRLARGLRDLINHMEDLHGRGVGFRSISESVDWTSAYGRLAMMVLGAVGEFERQLTIERTRAGIRAKRERGGTVGAPRKVDVDLAHRRFREGWSFRQVADEQGVVTNAVRRYVSVTQARALAAAGPQKPRSIQMRWSRVSPFGDRRCCTANCGGSARWHAEAGEREASIGSDYCSTCRDALDAAEIVTAARAVVAFDWSDNDADAVAAIERLRHAVSN